MTRTTIRQNQACHSTYSKVSISGSPTLHENEQRTRQDLNVIPPSNDPAIPSTIPSEHEVAPKSSFQTDEFQQTPLSHALPAVDQLQSMVSANQSDSFLDLTPVSISAHNVNGLKGQRSDYRNRFVNLDHGAPEYVADMLKRVWPILSEREDYFRTIIHFRISDAIDEKTGYKPAKGDILAELAGMLYEYKYGLFNTGKFIHTLVSDLKKDKPSAPFELRLTEPQKKYGSKGGMCRMFYEMILPQVVEDVFIRWEKELRIT